jgi:hypothetical protein
LDEIPAVATAATDWSEVAPIRGPLPRMEPIVDYEYRLIETRLERLRDAERHARCGQGYPTVSPLYRIMRGDTARVMTPEGLNAVERLTEFDQEIDETCRAIRRLPDYLKLPVLLTYLDPRKVGEKIPKELGRTQFFECLKCAKHRLVGLLLN